jgi:hypothetical protein
MEVAAIKVGDRSKADMRMRANIDGLPVNSSAGPAWSKKIN